MTHKQTYLFVILYNLMGTLAICSVYPSDPFFGKWLYVVYPLTLPVTIFSFGYRYAQTSPIYPVLIIQSVVLIISLLLVWLYKKRQNR